jgi:hypothetical protein
MDLLTLILLVFAFVLFTIAAWLKRADIADAMVAAGLALWVLATLLANVKL